MAYIPNSIERCAPILGYDPYAFIMDKPSNLKINKMQSPYDVDYYAVGPTGEKKTLETAEQKKQMNWRKFGRIALAAGAIGLAAFGGYKTLKGLNPLNSLEGVFKTAENLSEAAKTMAKNKTKSNFFQNLLTKAKSIFKK